MSFQTFINFVNFSSRQSDGQSEEVKVLYNKLYTHKNTRADGSLFYTFSYFVGKKRVKLPRGQHPVFSNETDAKRWAKQNSAKDSSESIGKILGIQFPQFINLLQNVYSPYQKERAPNSYKDCARNLERYCFHFFLIKRQQQNMDEWSRLYTPFKAWLRTDARTPQSTPLAVSTMNNVIMSLNTFLKCMVEYEYLDPTKFVKCSVFPPHLLNNKDLSNVIDKETRDHIFSEMSHPENEFFAVAWATGMRFNEIYGLTMASLRSGKIPSNPMKNELDRLKINYVGYVLLESQPADKNRSRDQNKSLLVKPLKSSKIISPKNSRIIPLFDKKIWNILAKRYQKQQHYLKQKIWTENPKDYLLFDDLDRNRLNNSLRKATKFSTFHDCRHSFVTRLVGETQSMFLVRMITGHKSESVFNKYLHIYEQIALEAEFNDQKIELID